MLLQVRLEGRKYMNVLSLFDGMSCGHIALERAGHKVDKYFASEIKPHAIKVTQDNYPDTIQLGDVCNVRYENGVLYSDNGEWKVDIDIVIGGSPCQDFSRANKTRAGLLGEKSGLFYQYYRILKEVNPKYWLLENVEMESMELEQISQALGTYPIGIDSRLVSAQTRARMYWTNIGPEFYNLLGQRHCDIPQPKNKKITMTSILENGWTNRSKAKCLLEGDSRPNVTPVKMFHRAYGIGFGTLIYLDKEHYINCRKHYTHNFMGMSADEIVCDSKVYNGLRYFTQNELEKLQTVPMGYTSCVNRNEAASLLGDGWTVDVIAHIFSFIQNGDLI